MGQRAGRSRFVEERLANGSGAVSMAAGPFAVLEWRAATHDAGYPAVLASGPLITSAGGHCASMGGEAAGEEQLRAAVRERAARGADIVKVMTSGGFATAGTQVMLCQFAQDELEAVVDEAHAAGLPVTAHAHGLP